MLCLDAPQSYPTLWIPSLCLDVRCQETVESHITAIVMQLPATEEHVKVYCSTPMQDPLYSRVIETEWMKKQQVRSELKPFWGAHGLLTGHPEMSPVSLYLSLMAKKYHVLSVKDDHPYNIILQEHSRAERESYNISKCPIPEDVFPQQIQAKLLYLERQWYLYETVRPFCSCTLAGDITCPRPTEPKPTAGALALEHTNVILRQQVQSVTEANYL